jgi:hypothetical protein
MRTDHDRGFVVSAGKGAVFMTSTNLIGIIQKSSADLGALRIPNNQGTLCDLIRMGTQNRQLFPFAYRSLLKCGSPSSVSGRGYGVESLVVRNGNDTRDSFFRRPLVL